MKKLLLSLGLFLAVSESFSQSTIGLQSNLNPSISNGFISWENTSSVGYQIRVYELKGDGNYVEIQQYSTVNNYYRLNSEYLDNTKYVYTILANVGGTDVTDPAGVKPPALGDESTYPFCSVLCNSPIYAYTLTLNNGQFISEFAPNGDPIYLDNGMNSISMSAEATYNENNMAVHFYRYMDLVEFNQVREAFWDYHYHYPVLKDNNNTISGNWDYFTFTAQQGDGIRNSSGVTLVGSNIIAMKKDAWFFMWMKDNATKKLLTATDALCTYPIDGVAGWSAIFNNENNWAEGNVDYPGTPYNQNLQCANNSFGGGGGADDPNGDLGPDAEQYFGDAILCAQNTFEETNNIDDFINGLDDCYGVMAPGGTGVLGGVLGVLNMEELANKQVVKYIISRMDKVGSEPLVVIPSAHDAEYVALNVNLETGLYLVQAILKGGIIIPMYVAHNENSLITINNASFASLEIIPNPIRFNRLKFKMEASKKMSVQVTATTLDGQVLVNETKHLEASTPVYENFQLTGTTVPYNQIIVKLIFADGSTIQKIAYKN